jgi:hypothetical protein
LKRVGQARTKVAFAEDRADDGQLVAARGWLRGAARRLRSFEARVRSKAGWQTIDSEELRVLLLGLAASIGADILELQSSLF